MKKGLIMAIFLLLAGFVFAEPCTYSESRVTELDGISIQGTPVENLVGNNAKAEVSVTDTNFTKYFQVEDGIVSLINETDDLNYRVSTDSCTIARLENASSDLQTEYDAGNIQISGVSGGAAVKVFFAKIVYWFVNLFS